jgi:hypothetical protein
MPRENDDACTDFVARVERSETRDSLPVKRISRISLRSIRATSWHASQMPHHPRLPPRDKPPTLTDLT